MAKKVWINKNTGEIRTSLPTSQRPGQQQESEEPDHVAEKGQQVKSIVDNVVNLWKETAGQNLRSAAVAPPPLPKPPPVARPRVVPPLPDDTVSFLPAVPNDLQLARRSPSPRRSRSRRRRNRDGSDGYRPPSPRRRRRRDSGSRSRSRGAFGQRPPDISDPTSLLPTGFATTTRRSKFSDDGNIVPEPMACATNRLLGRKVLQMPEQHIRALFGRGGATIQHVMRVTNAAIKIDHKGFGNPFGLVTVANNTEVAVALIKDTLDASGCPSHMVKDVTETAIGMT